MDRTWRLPGRGLNEAKLKDAGKRIATAYAGVSVDVEQEDPEFVTFFFRVPFEDDDGGGHAEVEVTVYDMGRDGLVLSLEADAGDNDDIWEDASQLAEDLADDLEGTPLDV